MFENRELPDFFKMDGDFVLKLDLNDATDVKDIKDANKVFGNEIYTNPNHRFLR